MIRLHLFSCLIPRLVRASWLAMVLMVSSVTFSLTSSTMAEQKPPLAELFPADTVAYLGIDSAATLKEKAKQTDFAKILDLDGIKPFVDQVETRAKSTSFDGLPVLDYLRIMSASQGKAAFAVVERPRSVSAFAVVLEVKEDADSLAKILTSIRSKLESNAFSPRATAAGSPIIAFDKVLPQKPRITQCWFQTPSVICLANDVELAESVLSRLTAASKGDALADSPLFLESLSACTELSSPDIWLFGVPTSIAQLSQRDPDDHVDPKEVLEKHGFDKLQAMAMKIEISQRDLELEYDLFIKAPKPFAKAMQMLQFEPSNELDPPSWLCDDLNNVIRMQWKTKDLPKYLAGPADDVMEQEGFFQGLLADLNSPEGPGVDIERELFDYFETPLLVIGRSDEVSDARSEHTLVAIKVSDEAKVALALRKLLINDPTVKSEVIPPANELWKLGSSKKAGGKGGVRFKSSGIMVLDGYLLMSSNVDGIRRLLESRAAKKPPLAQAPEYTRVKQQFGPTANRPGVLQVYFSMSRDIRTTYELLRKGKIESAESIYAQLITPFVIAERKAGAAYDFSKLPEFEKLSPLLGTAFAHGIETDQGWKLRGIIIKNPASKANQ
jgi:hypothetical protein